VQISDLKPDAEWMYSMLTEMSPLHRFINSPGLDKSFEILKKEIPEITIHEYPSGMDFGDWTVPLSWEVIEGKMTDTEGKIIASIEESHLFVAPYSCDVDGWFTKKEIEKHLKTSPDNPNAYALEHRYAYNYSLLGNWGITLPHKRWTELPDEKYRIKISVKEEDSTLKFAEYFLPGKSRETLCICAHIDELCNDNLSGCVAAAEILRKLATLDHRNYSYQLLLVPEMFGTLLYIYNNRNKVDNTFGMLNLETVGAGKNWVLKKSYPENTKLEKLLRKAMLHSKVNFDEISFFEGYGNDERYTSWPTLGIPGVAIQRFPFQQYHTSEDIPEIINKDYLADVCKMSFRLIHLIEDETAPVFTDVLPPWLTKRELYFDNIYNSKNHHKYNNLLLFNIDGKKSISDLAEISGLTYPEVESYINKFVDAGVIKIQPAKWR